MSASTEGEEAGVCLCGGVVLTMMAMPENSTAETNCQTLGTDKARSQLGSRGPSLHIRGKGVRWCRGQ